MEEMNWVLRQEAREELEVLSLHHVEPLLSSLPRWEPLVYVQG